MKTLLSILLIFSVGFVSAQQNHTVTAVDHYFSPDTLYMNSGDTVTLYSVGYHSMTEVDSVNWVANTATHNGGFWVGFGSPTSTMSFVLNQPGKYYYICQPHASMGMKGVIYVGTTSGIKDVTNEDDFSVAYLGNGNLKLNYHNADEIVVYNSLGQNVFISPLSSNANSEIMNVSLLTGTYFVVFNKSGKPLISKKVFVN
jgi:plastocyanin